MAKSKIITVQGRNISLISDQVNDYISLTDMADTEILNVRTI